MEAHTEYGEQPPPHLPPKSCCGGMLTFTLLFSPFTFKDSQTDTIRVQARRAVGVRREMQTQKSRQHHTAMPRLPWCCCRFPPLNHRPLPAQYRTKSAQTQACVLAYTHHPKEYNPPLHALQGGPLSISTHDYALWTPAPA